MLKHVLSLSTVTRTATKHFIERYSTHFSHTVAMSDGSESDNGPSACNIAQEACATSSHSEILTGGPVAGETNTSSDNPGNLSKRALKRLARKKVIEEKKQQKKAKKKSDADADKITQEQLQETSYYFENGLRKVYPYHYVFHTFAKGRWVGQKLVDIFLKEFRNDSSESYKAIQDGFVSVNGNTIGLDYVVKDNDYIENRVHRHELPVTGDDITVIHDDADVLVVNKPSSIPIHPCGRYRHNSLTYILAKEFNQFNLRTFYRIDRLTSGLMIFPKTEKKTAEMVDAVLKRNVEKTYICKVEGKFPENTLVCEEALGQLDFQLGLHKVDSKGKPSKTTFERLSFDPISNTSIVKCQPHTGRTHQIRVHLQWLGFPITNDHLYNSPVWGPNKGKNGDFGKPYDQLIADLKAHHSVENLGLPMEGGQPMTEKQSSEKCSDPKNSEKLDNTEEHIAKKPRIDAEINEKRPAFDPSKMTIDPDCKMCASNFPDPLPEKLVMFLHALAYKGEGWEYSTPMPSWAITSPQTINS